MEAKIIRPERDFIPLISARLSEQELLTKVKDISTLTKMQINAAAIKEVVYHILMNNTRGGFTHLAIIDSSLLFRATILDMIILCFANKEITKDQLPDTIYLGVYLVVETFFNSFFSKQYVKRVKISTNEYSVSP